MTNATALRNVAIAVFAVFFAVCALFITTIKPADAGTLVALDDLEPGNLIRGESFSAVYYFGNDGFRYVFPNDKTYFTWYENFDDVKWISDTDLGKLQIGGNVTYKPGVKMIKINTDPKTYAITNDGTLRHVTSEAIAIALYGADWNKMIDDVADGFFSNYQAGDPIESTDDYDADAEQAAATNIGVDKGLVNAVDVSITDSGYGNDAIEIEAGGTVRFTNNGATKHTATADDLSWGSGTIQPGGMWVRRFEESGTYTFFDSYESSFTGAVLVE